MSKATLLQILMGLGFLVGVVGVGRQLAYNLGMFGLRRPTNYIKVQFALYGAFVLIFGISILLQKLD